MAFRLNTCPWVVGLSATRLMSWTAGLKPAGGDPRRKREARNMQRPPDKRTAPEASRGGNGSGSTELRSKQSDSEYLPAAQAIIDATKRAEDLLTLWQEHRRLKHQIHCACLRFDHLDIEDEVVAELSREVTTWRRTVEALARKRAS